jgi:hypothetical protein
VTLPATILGQQFYIKNINTGVVTVAYRKGKLRVRYAVHARRADRCGSRAAIVIPGQAAKLMEAASSHMRTACV